MDNLVDFYNDDMAWKYEGNCSGYPLEMFFESYTEDKDTAAETDEICAGCPVRQKCLEYAKETEATGVWAGRYLVQGKYHKPSNSHKDRAQVRAEEEEYKNV